MLLKLVAIGLGGATGAIVRYLVTLGAQRIAGAAFWGTLAANLIGCFLIGLLIEIFALRGGGREALRLAILVGVLGGFTTFSTFGLEVLRFLQDGAQARAALYVLISVVGGVAAVWGGYRLGQALTA